MRIDKYLYEQGYAKSRSYALTMINQNIVYCNGKSVTKASLNVSENDVIEIRGEILKYVSRGGLKLEKALKHFNVTVNGAICVDIGASTGGFTDCLLQEGASRVYAIDSGREQLASKLRADPRVISIENTNVRFIDENTLPEQCDVAVCDVSFISQTLLHTNIAMLLKDSATFITLIKPQFEVGRSGLSKHGIVKNDDLRRAAQTKVIESATACGFKLLGLTDSPIQGGDGNLEYLACFQYHKLNV